ncbi:MAG: membrane protein insertion efficiency factor YidD [Planctomycetaceae bacterium]
MRRLFVALIDAYRRLVSPLLPPLCRFHPSCSAYAREAVQVHGAAKGVLLALLRLLRCNPACRGGEDPVPVAGRWRV